MNSKEIAKHILHGDTIEHYGVKGMKWGVNTRKNLIAKRGRFVKDYMRRDIKGKILTGLAGAMSGGAIRASKALKEWDKTDDARELRGITTLHNATKTLDKIYTHQAKTGHTNFDNRHNRKLDKQIKSFMKENPQFSYMDTIRNIDSFMPQEKYVRLLEKRKAKTIRTSNDDGVYAMLTASERKKLESALAKGPSRQRR